MLRVTQHWSEYGIPFPPSGGFALDETHHVGAFSCKFLDNTCHLGFTQVRAGACSDETSFDTGQQWTTLLLMQRTTQRIYFLHHASHMTITRAELCMSLVILAHAPVTCGSCFSHIFSSKCETPNVARLSTGLSIVVLDEAHSWGMTDESW